MNIISIFRKFPTQKSCIKHLEQARWGNKPVCPYCSSTNTNPLKKQLRHHCNGCRKSFSVTVGTIFHDTRLPMQKWFLAISLILNAKKGISARQLARDLEVNKDTAWSMAMRIREAMQDNGKLLYGIVEMNETIFLKEGEDSKYENEMQASIEEQLSEQCSVVAEAEKEIRKQKARIKISEEFTRTLQSMSASCSTSKEVIPTPADSSVNDGRKRAKGTPLHEIGEVILELEKQNQDSLGLTVEATRTFLAEKEKRPSDKRIRMSFSELNFVSEKHGHKLYYKRMTHQGIQENTGMNRVEDLY